MEQNYDKHTHTSISGMNPLPECLLLLQSSPHVTLLPGDDMKHGGDEEEGAQAHAVHPGRDPLPAVVRQTVQQRHPHEGWHDEELQG